MFVIGLTGGTGCGTSTVGKLLAQRGFCFIDADSVYHDMLANDSVLRNALSERFGSAIMTPEGLVDRRKLAGIVFSDSKALADLNRITHSAISARIKQMIAESGSDKTAVEAVELLESDIKKLCDKTVGVLSDTDVRAYRIMIRDAISSADAMARISAQRSDEYYRTRCDEIIENNGSMTELSAEVDRVLSEIKPDINKREED